MAAMIPQKDMLKASFFQSIRRVGDPYGKYGSGCIDRFCHALNPTREGE
jgi:hypothetical protein